MMDRTSYEFSDSQNQLIRNLSDKMRFVGYFLIATGALIVLTGLFAFTRGGAENGFSAIIQGVIQIVIGVWTTRAAQSFKRIVETSGNDIENLMGALGELRKLYALQFWLILIALIFIAIGFIVVLIATISGGA
jgi:hypothetical protein